MVSLDVAELVTLLALIPLAAVLYSSVGHGGAPDLVVAALDRHARQRRDRRGVHLRQFHRRPFWLRYSNEPMAAGSVAIRAGGTRRGGVGSDLAVRRLVPARLRKVLGVVLVIAGAKMFLTALA